VLLREGYDVPGVNASNILNYVVSANEFTSSALVGRFISDVTLKFSNVAALASRLTGVLTVLSVDRPDVFAESSFEGVLSPISGGGGQGIDLIPSGLNARDLFEKNRIAESKKVQTSGVAFFAKYSNFVPMTSESVNMTVPKVRRVQTQTETFDVLGALNRIKSKQALSSQEEHTFASAFCFKYFDKTVTHAAAYAECIKNPKAMMKFVVRDLVEKVNSPTPRALGKLPVETLSFMSGVTFTESTSTSKGQSSSNKRSVSFSNSLTP
jgi:hypothetical protein